MNEFFKARGIQASVERAREGLRTRQYLLKLDLSEKVSRIRSVEEDLSLHIQSHTRPQIYVDTSSGHVVVEVTTNTGALEIPFEDVVNEVDLSEHELPLVLGRDMQNSPQVVDLTSCPHLLVGGTTGSGKSVLLRSMIHSMTARYPEQEDPNLILLDPKGNELSDFKDLQQVLAYGSSYEDCVGYLETTIDHMEETYQHLCEYKLNDVQQLRAINKKSTPYVVCIIDELADLVLQDTKKRFKNALTRLVQKSRAAGIHIIAATQNPKRDIIDGLIKANIPTSIALRTSTAIESRVIIDQEGAERLVGKGDMLLNHNNDLTRIQGTLTKRMTFSERTNIQNVIDFMRGK